MKKKLLSLILVATMSFGITACGNSTDSKSVAELEEQTEELQQQVDEEKQGQTAQQVQAILILKPSPLLTVSMQTQQNTKVFVSLFTFVCLMYQQYNDTFHELRMQLESQVVQIP